MEEDRSEGMKAKEKALGFVCRWCYQK